MSDGKRDNIDDRSMVCVPIAALVGVEWHMLFCVSLFTTRLSLIRFLQFLLFQFSFQLIIFHLFQLVLL